MSKDNVIPEDFFAEIEAMLAAQEAEEQAAIKVPKGWTTEEDELEDTGEDEMENEHIVLHDAELEDPEEFSEDDGEPEDILPESPVVDPTYDDGTVAAPLPPVRQRRPAFAVEDFDDEPAPVVRPKAKPRGFAIDDDFDDEPVLKPRLTVGSKGEPVVHLDDEPEAEPITPWLEPDEDDEPTTPMVVHVTEVDANDEPIAEPYIAPARQETIVPVKRLSEKALLVALNISQWSGRRFDRQVSDEVNAQKAGSTDAGRFNKMLLPGCAELAEVHRQTSSLRNWFVSTTLPWMNDGARITPSSSYLTFTAEFRQRKAEWINAVDALIAAYPGLVAQAPAQLKSMYNPEDYPHPSELRRKFGMDIKSFPLPDKEDFRVELDAVTVQALKDSMADTEGDIARQVVGECYQRLGKAVGAMAERLSQPDAVFRNSLTENLAEAVMALKDLNITGDPKLEALRRHVEKTLGGFTADELRTDMAARKAAADSAKAVVNDITSRMAGLY